MCRTIPGFSDGPLMCEYLVMDPQRWKAAMNLKVFSGEKHLDRFATCCDVSPTSLSNIGSNVLQDRLETAFEANAGTLYFELLLFLDFLHIVC